MKKLFITLSALCLSSISLWSQAEFTKVWTTEVDVENKWHSNKKDLSMILIGDLKTFAMVDGTNGKTLWSFNAKERLGVKSVEDWTFLWAMEQEPVEVVYNKPKEDTKTTIYLDSKTGNVISSLTESTLKEKDGSKNKYRRSHTKFATKDYDKSSETLVELYFKDKFFKNSYAGNTFEVTVRAFGGYIWNTPIKARAVTHINRLLLSSDEPDIMMNVMIANDKVFVLYEGITALDLKTGKELWTTSFDMVDAGMTSQEIGKAPKPTVDNNAVYICDLSKGEKAIKKLDVNTGNLIWKSEKLDKDEVISQLGVVGNNLVAKFGGIIRKAKNVYNPNNGATTRIAKNVFEGKSDIRVFDAATGKELWSAEKIFKEDKFSNSECSIFMGNNNIVACSNKFIYLVEPSTGNVKSKTELGKEIGKPKYIFEYDGNFIVEGEEGIASFSSNGAKNYAVSTKKVLMTEFVADVFIVWTGKDTDDMNEFIRFDLKTGKIMGKLKDCYTPYFNEDGSNFLRYKENTITKYQTN